MVFVFLSYVVFSIFLPVVVNFYAVLLSPFVVSPSKRRTQQTSSPVEGFDNASVSEYSRDLL